MQQLESVLSEAETAARLNAAGLRSTGPRRAAIRVLSRGGHWSAASVFEAVVEELDGTSLQAMYGVLSAMSEAGILRKIELPGSPALYELRVNDNHHHLICTVCGDIRDVPCAVGEAPCLTAADDYGFAISQAEVTYHGICPDCHQAAADAGVAPAAAASRLTSHPQT